MATRHFQDATFDHGAQFFTVRTEHFGCRVATWRQQGVVEEWYSLDPNSRNPASHCRFRGSPSMNAPAKKLAEHLRVVSGTQITGLSRLNDEWHAQSACGKTFEAKHLVLTAPAPQAHHLLSENDVRSLATGFDSLSHIRYDKCIATMAILDGPSGIISPGILRRTQGDAVALIVDNQLKGISPVPAVTLHSGALVAEAYFDATDEEKSRVLTEAAAPYLQSGIVAAQSHRWRYAQPQTFFPRTFFADDALNLYLAGDAFGGGRIEGAAVSGSSLGTRLAGKILGI